MKYDNEPKPPEWWTTENTEAWTRERWADGSQGGWGSKITGRPAAPRSRAELCAPVPPELMAQWRLNDPRPSATHYYDGRPIERYQPLRTKKVRAPRKAKVAA